MATSDNKTADTDEKIFIGKGEQTAWLALALANRHGLVTGATGTGKTVSLQVMAEGFARAGVPVFAADIKGDLSGISEVGEGKDFILKRAKEMGLNFQPDQFSTVFWDVFGEQGHPVRATVTEMGPLLLSRMLDLNDVQEGVLNVAFRVADENGLTLIDMKDLRSLLDAIVPAGRKKGPDAEEDPLAEIRKAAQSYGNVSKATVGTIQRQLLVLENQGATKFFGEPALALKDFMKTDSDGRGMVNILVADKLMESPRLYATFLLWLLSELFEELPEAGDLPKPKLVFFFDEAHLLFNDAPKALMDKIEQVVRLIRSKGVGVYFVTQNPIDVPDKVLAQLGGRVQHALRAFTPRDQKAVNAAAQTFRPNPKLDTARVIMELGKGEALVSFLEGGGTPTMVERVMIRPPTARIGPITPEERKAIMNKSPVKGKYDTAVDAESAYEMLQKRVAGTAAPADGADGGAGGGGILGQIGSIVGTIFGTNVKRGRMSTGQVIARDVTRSVTNKVIGGVVADLGKVGRRIARQFDRALAGARRARRIAAAVKLRSPSDLRNERVLRYPSLRRPLDLLFLVCCIALTADVLVPEIWGNGKTKDYPLWFWAGQQVLQGRNLYPDNPASLFRFHLSAAVGGAACDPELVRQDPALSLPVVPQHRRVVDDGAVLARDGGIGAEARAVAGSAAGLRHRHLRVRHVRPRPAEPRAAGADALRVLAAARSPWLDGGKHVCAGHRHQGVSGGGAALSGVAKTVGGGREHAGVHRRVSVRAAGAVSRLPAQRRGAEDLVPGHGGDEFGEGVRTARRAELVVGQPVDHRDDAPADAARELQSGSIRPSPCGR